MICQLHIIILCKSGEPKRYTNLYKRAKLVNNFYFGRIFFRQDLTFYTYLTLRVDYSHLFVFLILRCFTLPIKQKNLPSARGEREVLLYENSNVAKQECQLIIVICIPILQSEGFFFIFPQFIKILFVFYIEFLS